VLSCFTSGGVESPPEAPKSGFAGQVHYQDLKVYYKYLSETRRTRKSKRLNFLRAYCNSQEVNMPYYDLKCDKCKEEFNIKASISERENKSIKCPNCGSDSLSAIFSNVNIIQSRRSEPQMCPNIDRCGGCCRH
jgi:putative FmdB family regulatory protein